MSKRIGRRRRVIRIKDALMEQRGAGKRISGKLPYGWSLGDDGKTLVINDAEQDAIMEIWWQAAIGWSYRTIAQSLDEIGFKPRGGGKWQASTVRSIYLTCEKYRHLLSSEQYDAISERRSLRLRGGKPAVPFQLSFSNDDESDWLTEDDDE